jgi:hypothetical protein
MEATLAAIKTPAEVLGTKLLRDIEKEEGSLEAVGLFSFSILFFSSVLHRHRRFLSINKRFKVTCLTNLISNSFSKTYEHTNLIPLQKLEFQSLIIS